MQTKGAALRNTFAGLTSLHGAKVVRAVLDAMPEEPRAVFEGKIIPAGWYPVSTSAAFHAAIRDVVGKGSWAVSHAISLEAARLDFTGIYRLLLRAVQYDTIWDRMERAWPHYYTQGDARWAERQRGSAIAVCEGVEGFNPGMWHAVAGRCQGLLLLSGARGAQVELIEGTATRGKLSALWLE